jgi:hypothetical protein
LRIYRLQRRRRQLWLELQVAAGFALPFERVQPLNYRRGRWTPMSSSIHSVSTSFALGSGQGFMFGCRSIDHLVRRLDAPCHSSEKGPGRAAFRRRAVSRDPRRPYALAQEVAFGVAAAALPGVPRSVLSYPNRRCWPSDTPRARCDRVCAIIAIGPERKWQIRTRPSAPRLSRLKQPPLPRSPVP